MEPAIRSARADDALAIATLQVATWRTAYRGLLPDSFLAGLSTGDREQQWRRLLGRGVRVVVSEGETAGGRALTGFASCGPSRDAGAPSRCGELYALYVHPDAWGGGVGGALHEAALTELVRAGHVEATLWVLAGNERAQRFYARHAWRPDGGARAEELPGALLHELRYRRRLAAAEAERP